MSHRLLKGLATYTITLALGSQMIAAGQESPSPTRDLSSLSLEDLTHVDVSSASRKPQELFKTPAAVFVITREDIKASGVNSLPEIFRMVPGMQVAQVDANTWAVTARGFNGQYGDKVLVLIDGRSIYSEIYAGVFWDQNDVALEDIDRIEVIRGPGGSLWGANAVNGVINIITRSARQTLGTKVVAVGGNMENGGNIRRGATLGQKFAYRGSVKYLRRSALRTDQGASSDDAGYSLTTGARGDLQATANDLVTFDERFMYGSGTQNVKPFDSVSTVASALDAVTDFGGDTRVRWEHRFSGSDLAVQTYYADEYRKEVGGTGREHFLDFDFQHHLPSFHRNDVVWGLGYRLSTDRIDRTPTSFSSDHHLDALYSLFFQDDYAMVPDKLVFTGGLKLQHNSYTGFEIQPGGRVLWTPDSKHSLWASVSRAVRTPSVQYLDLHLFESLPPENGLPTQALALGNPNFKSEEVIAYESGYRQSVGDWASLDVATFINSYTNLRSQAALAPYLTYSPGPTLVVPVMYGNDEVARTHGAEVSASANATRSLHLRVSYTWMNAHIHLSDGSIATLGETWSSPTNTVNFRPTWTLARHWTLDSSVYSVSRLERVSPTGISPVKGFVRLDTHISFNFFESLKLTAGVNNILQIRHPEFDPVDVANYRSQVPRSAFLKAVWSF